MTWLSGAPKQPMQAEPITDPVAYHGEGPVWSPAWGGLRWVDMLAGDVLQLRPNGSVERRHIGTICRNRSSVSS